MNVKLVKNGIFPIIYDKNGKKLEKSPDTSFNCAGTIQGEGKLLGTSCLFIRFSGCNLRCTWELPSGDIDICDTSYSSHHPDEYDLVPIDDVISIVKHNLGNLRHIVITGGEPTFQPKALTELVTKLRVNFKRIHLTLETNGINFIPKVAQYIDLFSISPKLSASIPTIYKIAQMKRPIDKKFSEDHSVLCIDRKSFQSYIDACYELGNYYSDNDAYRNNKDFQFKFVVTKPEDEEEIKSLLDKLYAWTGDDIIIMPVGSNKNVLKDSTMIGVEMAIRNGWRFSPRTHIDLFGDKKGV